MVDGQAIPLSTNLYPNAIHPEGYKQCIGFTTDPWPAWTYNCHGTVVQRQVFCVRGRDLVVIRWTLAGKTKEAVTLRVRPMVNGRDYHATHHNERQAAYHRHHSGWWTRVLAPLQRVVFGTEVPERRTAKPADDTEPN